MFNVSLYSKANHRKFNRITNSKCQLWEQWSGIETQCTGGFIARKGEKNYNH